MIGSSWTAENAEAPVKFRDPSPDQISPETNSKSFVSLDDADHLLTNERDSFYAGDVIAAWASRYFDG